MKENIAKNTLSFSCSKKMKYLRTPVDIWEDLSNEFNFTCDMCASNENHLLDKYYTAENSALNHDWDNEIGYVHPLFDSKIGKFVEKASKSKGTFVFLLPASTHTKYFQDNFYNKPNVEIRFLRKPKNGFRFGDDDGTIDDGSGMGYIKPLMICIMVND
jgi:phage N-6-adenine-methyltransferase|tara:strand:- start:382 stop:858 length:477 start_codon:yes stop_codon:yes gene_type:complete